MRGTSVLDNTAARRFGAVPGTGLIALTLLLAAPVTEAEATPVLRGAASDTVQAAPRLFQGRVLFSTGYLQRAIEMAQRRDIVAALAPVSVGPPSPVEQYPAESYARRYNISRDLASTIIEMAVAEGIDPDLGFRLVRVESVFRPNARGAGGALGLTQLMPSTARAVDRSLRSDAQILEPETNLRVGFRYLRRMIERYDGDVRLGLLAYNRGSVAVDRALQAGRDPENGYSPKVLGRAATRYRGAGLLDGQEP
jgi:soluble lytic murein transglycosylase-like protein